MEHVSATATDATISDAAELSSLQMSLGILPSQNQAQSPYLLKTEGAARQINKKYSMTAGAGKTTQLISDIVNLVNQGYQLQNMMITSFSRTTVQEVEARLRTKLSHFNHFDWQQETRYIRTQHSISWGYIRHDFKLLSWREKKQFQEEYGWKLNSWNDANDDELYTQFMKSDGDSVDESAWKAINLGRLTCTDPATLLEYPREKPIMERLLRDYTEWRNKNNYIDFIGMIEEAVKRQVTPTNLTHIFVDEAQDMCPLLYEYHKVLYSKLPRAEINWYGDEDQCVYKFMGADPKIMVAQPAEETIYGEQSYRLPEAVATMADTLISRNQERLAKRVIGTEKPCKILKEFSILRAAQALEELKPTGNVLWLTSTNYQAKDAKDLLQTDGYPVRHDAESQSLIKLCAMIAEAPHRLKRAELEAIRDARLDGKKIFPFTKLWFTTPHKASERFQEIISEPGTDGIPIDDDMLGSRLQAILRARNWKLIFDQDRNNNDLIERLEGMLSRKDSPYEIELSTFHRAKGREAQNVVVCLDLKGKMQASVYDDIEAGRRMLFVAITRTKENLILYRDDWKRGIGWDEATR